MADTKVIVQIKTYIDTKAVKLFRIKIGKRGGWLLMIRNRIYWSGELRTVDKLRAVGRLYNAR